MSNHRSATFWHSQSPVSMSVGVLCLIFGVMWLLGTTSDSERIMCDNLPGAVAKSSFPFSYSVVASP